MIKTNPSFIVFLFALLICSVLPADTWAQNPPQTQPPILALTGEDYRIGPRDVVEVYILKMPELSRQYRVAANGIIEIPFLGRIKAQQKTAQELAATIADGLRGDFLVDPQVSVIVQQINRRFFIQGAVHSPGVYNIEGQPSLLELISIAGGLNPSYGATAFIIRNVRQSQPEAAATTLAVAAGPATEADAETQPQYELKKANINALLRGEFGENAAIEPGDIVHIPVGDVFFVAGEVKAPGSFPLKEGTTLRQAISLAQGTTPVAAPGRAVIFREDEGGQKREIPVDVGDVMRGRNPDLPIAANDIIVIPNNKAKSVFVPIVNAFGVNAAYLPLTLIR